MRLLFIGDVVGRSGRTAVAQQAPLLRARWNLDFIIVNGENAAGGFGLTESIFEEFLAAGVDAVTLGNHAFDQREALVFIERQPRLIRPANFPPIRSRTAAKPSWWTSMPRRRARNARLAISPMGGRALSPAPTRTSRAPTIASSPAEPASSPTSA